MNLNEKYAKKRFGQNFLNDKNILEKITNVIDISNKNIIEIGPGKGALTSLLIKKAKKVIAFEIDKNLFDYLNDKFKSQTNLEIINQDFLKVNLSKYENFNIVANIPYNISTDILFKIFDNYQNFENIVLLVQSEFAKRVCAKVNDNDYSKLAPSTKLFYDATYCFDVNASSFWPKPKVTSAVIHLKRTNKIYDIDKREILKFIKLCFSMRRKTLWNNIKILDDLNKEQFEQMCNDLKININSRPEEIDLDKFIEIYKWIYYNK